jgi:protein-tyrosine phosphatase
MTERERPKHLWNEIVPGLWMGGTDKYDRHGRTEEAKIPTKKHFDVIYTFFNRARGAVKGIREIRYGFEDGPMNDFSPENELAEIVAMAHRDWKTGKRVYIRCQGGLNRSGLVTALVLIRDGWEPQAAIDRLRSRRGEIVLCNQEFVDWLTNEADLEFWRKPDYEN